MEESSIPQNDQCSSWVGIDLGTTNSCLAVWRNGKVEVIANEDNNLTPTCVSFKPGEEPIVGNCARKQRFIHPENTIFEMKRLFGRNFNESFVKKMKEQWPFKIVDDGHGKPIVEIELAGKTQRIRPVDIQAMVLKNMRESAERLLGHSVTKAVITVPAYFNSEAKAETMEAARIAGFDEGSTLWLHEPTAAAYYYGYCAQKYNDYRLLVFDLGGGTFDVTILHVLNTVFVEKGIDGINDLGGHDFDWQMFGLAVKKIKEKYGAERNVHRDKGCGPYLWAQCQTCKERLSTNNVARVDVSEVFADLDGEVIIERKEYEEAIRPLVEQAMEKVRKLMADTKLQPKDINEVLLVGGSTRLPLVQKMLKAEFHKEHLNMSLNADEAVCCGAAIYAAKQCENVKEGVPYIMSIIEATPLKLGASGKDGRCYVLIERNTPLPHSSQMKFIIKHVLKKSVTTYVKVYEGERRLEGGNRVLGTLILEDLHPNENGEVINMLKYELDQNGMLTATYWNMRDCRKEHKQTFDYRKLQTNREDAERKLEEAERNRIVDEAEHKRLVARHRLEEAIGEIQYKYHNQSDYEDSDSDETLLRQSEEMQTWLTQNREAELRTFESKLRQMQRSKQQKDDRDYMANLNPFSSSSDSDSEEDYDDDDELEYEENRQKMMDSNGKMAKMSRIVGVDGIGEKKKKKNCDERNGIKKQRIG